MATLETQNGAIIPSVEADRTTNLAQAAFDKAVQAVADAAAAYSFAQSVSADAANASSQATVAISLANAAQSTANNAIATQVSITGATLTGPLILHADPITSLQAATKQYVDNSGSSGIGILQPQIDSLELTKLPKSGGTMTGFLTLHAAPTSNLHAATKKYVDDQDAPYDTFISTTFPPTQTNAANALTNAATAQSTANTATTLANTAQTTANNANTNANNRVARSGDTMTGALTLPANPTANLHAATKQYVDTRAQMGTSPDYLRYLSSTDSFDFLFNDAVRLQLRNNGDVDLGTTTARGRIKAANVIRAGAMVEFNPASSTWSMIDNYNISTFTRVGKGYYRFTFPANTFTDTSYFALTSQRASDTLFPPISLAEHYGYTRTTTTFELISMVAHDTGSDFVDALKFNIVFYQLS